MQRFVCVCVLRLLVPSCVFVAGWNESRRMKEKDRKVNEEGEGHRGKVCLVPLGTNGTSWPHLPLFCPTRLRACESEKAKRESLSIHKSHYTIELEPDIARLHRHQTNTDTHTHESTQRYVQIYTLCTSTYPRLACCAIRSSDMLCFLVLLHLYPPPRVCFLASLFLFSTQTLPPFGV